VDICADIDVDVDVDVDIAAEVEAALDIIASILADAAAEIDATVEADILSDNKGCDASCIKGKVVAHSEKLCDSVDKVVKKFGRSKISPSMPPSMLALST
jgi:hypothetical protein